MRKKSLFVIGSVSSSALVLAILFLLLRGLPAKAALSDAPATGQSKLAEIRLSPGTTKKAAPGDVVSYTHWLTNTYLTGATVVSLTSNSSRGWEISHALTRTLEARETESLVVNVEVPVGVAGIADVTTITATWKPPLAGPLEAVSARDTTLVENGGEIKLSPGTTKTAAPGEVLSYPHWLTNTYLAGATVVSLTSSSSQDWKISHLATETLEAGQTEVIVVKVHVPVGIEELAEAASVTNVTTITATWNPPLGESLGVVTATDTTLVERPSYAVQLPMVLRAYYPPIRTWRQGGLAGKLVYQIAVCATDSDQLYAATETGVFRSLDAGASWQPTALQGVRVRGLDVAAGDCDTVYAATYGQYVKKSENGGQDWETLSDGLPSPYLYTVVVDDQPVRLLYAGTAEDGVYSRNEIGGTWEPAYGQAAGLMVARLTLVESSHLLVATWGDNAYRLKFMLGSWHATPLDVTEDNVFEVVQTEDGDLLAATDNYLYRHTGGGWTEVHNQRTFGVAPDPDQPEVIYAATEDGALRSTDGGENFGEFGLDDVIVRDVAPGPAGSTLLHVGTEDGAWRRSRP